MGNFNRLLLKIFDVPLDKGSKLKGKDLIFKLLKYPWFCSMNPIVVFHTVPEGRGHEIPSYNGHNLAWDFCFCINITLVLSMFPSILRDFENLSNASSCD